MKITKLGHCCLVIEIDNVKIMTDPGAWTTAQNDVKNIDFVLITHEHPDHLHIESVKTILANNPRAKIITNTAVAKILSAEGIEFEILEHGQQENAGGVSLEGLGDKHKPIYPTVPQVQNTGYMIADRFFYPGDALFVPDRKVEILALPVAGPWLTLAQAIDYAKAAKPKICFPVHDGMLKFPGPYHALPEKALKEEGIDFRAIADSGTIEQ